MMNAKEESESESKEKQYRTTNVLNENNIAHFKIVVV